MKRGSLLLGILACALVLGMSATPAMAYFTDTNTANGGLNVRVTPSTDIYERYENKTKSITITNAADATTDVFVRVRSDAPAVLEQKITSNGWFEDDGWWYYGSSHQALTPLAPGKTTNVNGTADENYPVTLSVGFTFPKEKRIGDKVVPVEGGDNLNVVVLYEAVPATYNSSGETAADWDYKWNTTN